LLSYHNITPNGVEKSYKTYLLNTVISNSSAIPQKETEHVGTACPYGDIMVELKICKIINCLVYLRHAKT